MTTEDRGRRDCNRPGQISCLPRPQRDGDVLRPTVLCLAVREQPCARRAIRQNRFGSGLRQDGNVNATTAVPSAVPVLMSW